MLDYPIVAAAVTVGICLVGVSLPLSFIYTFAVIARPSPQRSRWLTNMEMMPLNFSSTRSQIILLLKYWTGSH